jgi:two-component system LytT family response regulator
MRVHRSAAVNTARIRELRARSHGEFTVVLQNGVEVPMSRGYRGDLESWLHQTI